MDNDDESERERARHGIVAGRPVKRVEQERARALRMNMTAEEALLWERLRARRLDGLHWRRQQVIAGFIVDFYCHATGVAVELDGAFHLGQAEYDHDRDDVLARSGLLVLRFTNDDIHAHLPDVIARIRDACQHRYP